MGSSRGKQGQRNLPKEDLGAFRLNVDLSALRLDIHALIDEHAVKHDAQRLIECEALDPISLARRLAEIDRAAEPLCIAPDRD